MSELLALLTGDGLPKAPQGRVGRIVRLLDDDECSEDGSAMHPCKACGQILPGDAYRIRKTTGAKPQRMLICRHCEAGAERQRSAERRRTQRTQKEQVALVCSRCNELRLVTEYYVRATLKGNAYSFWCKSCHRVLARESAAKRRNPSPRSTP